MTRQLVVSAVVFMLSFSGLCIEIGDFTFDYNLTEKTGKLTAYHGTSSYVNIPSSFEVSEKYKDDNGEMHTRYHTITLTGIDAAFKDNTSIVHVTIPDSVSWLYAWGSGVFKGCTALQSVTLSRNIAVIPSRTFMYCGNLRSIDLSNVEKIEFHAFKECSNLNAIGSLENAIEIGNESFSGCSALSGELNLSSIQVIEDGAFKGTAFTKVRTGSGLRVFENSVFSDCLNLEEAVIYGTFPDGRELQVYSFKNCGNLRRAEIRANLVFHEYRYYNSPFQGCRKLEEVLLGSSFTFIATGTFSGLTNLRKITYTNNMKDIHTSAFQGCTSLNDISFSSITNIEQEAFKDCIALQSLTMPSIVKISDNAFNGCTNLQSVWIGTHLRLDQSDKRIFQNCTALQSATINGDGEMRIAKLHLRRVYIAGVMHHWKWSVVHIPLGILLFVAVCGVQQFAHCVTGESDNPATVSCVRGFAVSDDLQVNRGHEHR